MAVGQLPVFGFLVARRLVSCRPCCGRRVCEVGVGIGVRNRDVIIIIIIIAVLFLCVIIIF